MFNIKIKEINVDADYDIFYVHWKFSCRVLIHIVSEVSLVDKQDALKSYVKVGIFKSTVSRYIYMMEIRLICIPPYELKLSILCFVLFVKEHFEVIE